MAPQKGKRKVKTSARESMRKRGILKVPKGAPVCHSRSALAIRPAISCLLGLPQRRPRRRSLAARLRCRV